jgi:hypothetical protein
LFDDARELVERRDLLVPDVNIVGMFCWTERTRDVVVGSSMRCAQDAGAFSPTSTAAVVTVVRSQPSATYASIAFAPFTHHYLRASNKRNGALTLCLADGDDQDLLTEGCADWGQVVLAAARPADAAVTFATSDLAVAIHSSDDREMPTRDGVATDDVVLVDGLEFVERPD